MELYNIIIIVNKMSKKPADKGKPPTKPQPGKKKGEKEEEPEIEYGHL